MYQFISKLVFMFSLSTTCTSSKLNLTRLMNIYINACGEHGVCKDWPGLTGYQRNSIQSRCPPCSCEDNCVREKNCCPDKFFEGKLTRFHDAVFQEPSLGNKRQNFPKYHVVDSCPEFAEKPEKCQSPVNQIKDRNFVTSIVSNFTYYNIYCALCNGEKESDTVEWDISIDGETNFINFIESTEEMQRIMKEQKSLVLFSPSPRLTNIVFDTYLKKNQYFTEVSCSDDEDLQTACSSSYVNMFRLYKNVFCYMCKLKNMGRSQHSINTCLQLVPNRIQQLCTDNPVSDTTYPYRNFYCFLCNIPTINDTRNSSDLKDIDKKYVFIDFSSYVSESVEERGEMLSRRRLTFYNSVFNDISIINKILNTKLMKNQLISPTNQSKTTMDQLKPFLSMMASVYPHRICNKAILSNITQNTPIRNCDCSFSCMFKNPCSCCLDTALIHPIKCVSNARIFFSDENTVLKQNEVKEIQVVNVCYERMDIASMVLHQTIKQLCEGELKDLDIPVLSNRVTYKNIFCFLCNTNYTIENNSLSSDAYSILDINVFCEDMLQFDFLIHFREVLAHAIKNKCDITYNFNDVVLCPMDALWTIKTKNDCKTNVNQVHLDQVENWTDERHQSFFSTCRYKNDFCQLCSWSNTLEVKKKVEICKESNIQHVIYRNACLPLSIEHHNDLVHPNRNIFCSYCMEEYNESNQSYSSKGCKPVLGYKLPSEIPLMRDLFVPTMALRASTFQVKSESSGHACFPGRVLIDGSCKPIIASPSTMKYDIHIRCSLKVTSLTNDTELLHVLSEVKSAVVEVLSNSNYISDCKVQQLFLLANPRDVMVYQQELFYLELQITLHYVLLCSKYFKPFVRDNVENDLLQTPHMLKINHTIDGPKKISFVLKGISFCNLSRTLAQSSLIPENEYKLFKTYFQFIVLHRPHDGIIVSQLLICRQRVIDFNDLFFDFKYYRIIVKDSNEVFYLGEYVKDYNGNIRVCAKNQSVHSVETGISEILEILTNVLNSISIFCIILLYVIYLKFPALRTVPGMNVMSTSFSLMCMQLTYTIANVLQKDTLPCQITGVLLHYFWLCLCCCLFICCFHMFLTFRGVSNFMHGHGFHKQFVKYVLFCYTFPFIIVFANLVLSYYINGSIGYGTKVCFVEYDIQNIITFIAPLLLTCVCNAIMFILTIINIDLDKNLQKSKENMSELVIFTKLFCLTGSVWILQVIDSFLQISFFSFVVTILTSSQGIFIFLSFSSSSHIKKFFKSR